MNEKSCRKTRQNIKTNQTTYKTAAEGCFFDRIGVPHGVTQRDRI
ncbi:hypothetical protein SDC9_175655 [bioreactor metagenome]|uniref:Uncharacterized protein n=1 Tax=bioreactor metagenome TaxID=1076179 RepID=A0A645GW06_9ZZZZ